MNVKGLFGDQNKHISTSFLYLKDELLTNIGEGKLISLYLFPLISDGFICPAAVTPYFKFICTLHILFANFEHVS